MRPLDWIVLIGAVVFIVTYGVWKGRGSKDLKGYLLSNRNMKWTTIALSIMATQASAITFLSTPGQAYADGMRFVQFYFGLPIAAVILAITAIPLYHRLNVYTAYEFLESRFDVKVRCLAALLFLISRGVAAGLTIFAPALVLSVILGWDLTMTNIGVGLLVIIYTASGGTRAVSWTQSYQMMIIMFGMVMALGVIFYRLPEGVGVIDATRVAGTLGRLNAIDFSFDFKNKYSIWSGIIGGCFLQLAYFGTDQSQVQRYLTGSSIMQSRMGLLVNGLVKVPMQFFILFVGAMVFVFYQFTPPPLFFNPVEVEKVRQTPSAAQYAALEVDYLEAASARRVEVLGLIEAQDAGDATRLSEAQERLQEADGQMSAIRDEAVGLMQHENPGWTNDTNYVFLTYVVNYLPAGLVGLLIAAILFASMSSTSSEINALASTSVVDVYKRLIKPEADDAHYLWVSKALTVAWGLMAIGFAELFRGSETLVEAVNIVGSLFYGTILGIFLAAFYSKSLSSKAVFIGAVVAEITVLTFHVLTEMGMVDIAYLWYNVIGCAVLFAVAFAVQPFMPKSMAKGTA